MLIKHSQKMDGINSFFFGTVKWSKLILLSRVAMSFLFGEVYALSQLMTDATGRRVLFQGIHEEHEESLGEEHRRGSRHSGRGGHRRNNQKEIVSA